MKFFVIINLIKKFQSFSNICAMKVPHILKVLHINCEFESQSKRFIPPETTQFLAKKKSTYKISFIGC